MQILQFTDTGVGFQINAAMSDAWFFPDASGQGFFIILCEDQKLVFLDLEAFAQMLPISYLAVVLVAAAETGGGLLVLLGGFRQGVISDLATRIGAALNVPVMIGAIAMIHWGQWNFVPSATHPMGGFEFQAVLLLVMVYFVITGNRGFAVADSTRIQAA